MPLVYVLGVLQVKLEQLNEAKKSLKAMVEEIKYSGSTGAHRRKLVRHTQLPLLLALDRGLWKSFAG